MTFEQLLEEMNNRYSDVVEDPDQFVEYCSQLEEKYNEQVQKLAAADATIKYLSAKLYAPKSEKTEYLDYKNSLFSLLDEEIEVTEEPAEEETVEVKAHRRPKTKGHKEQLLKDFPHEKRISDIPEEDRKCDVCGSDLSPVGEEFVRSEVVIEPPKISVVDYYVKTYECRQCRKDTSVAHMIKPDVPEPLIRHSFASPSLVSQVIHNKLALALPTYRQEKEWQALGLDISRETMSNWMIITCRDWLGYVTDRLRDELLNQGYLHVDETPMQVMKEPGRKNTTKSYFWVYASIKDSLHPVRMFVYEPGRSGDFPSTFLDGYNGTIITDAYNGYLKVQGVNRALCWAHARRAYTDALPSGKGNDKRMMASEGVERINKLFETERELEALSASERLNQRKTLMKPMLEAYWAWVDENIVKTLPKSAVGKALSYSYNNREGLNMFMKDGNIPLSNNLAENSIRPVVVGRKNFLFCGSPGGAAATACIYSIVETAKANGLDSRKYIEYLLTVMPGFGYNRCREHIEELMPWTDEVQKQCR